jgi:hypothetical protein
MMTLASSICEVSSLLVMLELSFTIEMDLKYRPQVETLNTFFKAKKFKDYLVVYLLSQMFQ